MPKQWSNYLNFLGLFLAVYMLYETRRDAIETEATLESSIHEQERLRNLLWINLLMQRSSNLAHSAYEKGDLSELDRAGNISESITPYLTSDTAEGSASSKLDAQSRSAVHGFQEQMRQIQGTNPRSAEMRGLVGSLSPTLDGVGQWLNKAESEAWYALLDHNQKLVANLKANYSALMRLLGLFVGYLLFLGWVNHRKERAETALRESESKLASAAKMSALGEMAGGIAHEINNPLATISLKAEQSLELLQENGDTTEAAKMIQTVSKTARRIADIVQGLRTFSRDGSRDPFAIVPLARIVESTLALCRERCKNGDIELIVDPILDSVVVSCRDVQISQILLNLIGNAVDATSSLPDRWIRISVAEQGNNVELSVLDCGKGIDKAHVDKLFQPFFTTKPVGKGTGLGLSIARGIAEAHGGKLFVDTKAANTRFVLQLPKPPAAVRTLEARAAV